MLEKNINKEQMWFCLPVHQAPGKLIFCICRNRKWIIEQLFHNIMFPKPCLYHLGTCSLHHCMILVILPNCWVCVVMIPILLNVPVLWRKMIPQFSTVIFTTKQQNNQTVLPSLFKSNYLFFANTAKMTSVCLDIIRYSTQKSNWLYYW